MGLEHAPADAHVSNSFVCFLPRDLTRMQDVSLWRLQALVALSPRVTWAWGLTKVYQGMCPKCSAPVAMCLGIAGDQT